MKMMTFKTQKKSFALIASAVAGVSLFAACTVRTPTTETPVPNDRGIEKTFFSENVVTTAADGKTETKARPKTFLCGWAPISETGAWSTAALTHAVHMGGHCNMEFEITENAVVGRMVNPTYPNDRARWKQGISFPIKKHYYYERAKDNFGRDTNEFVENTSRSHWSARPMIDLSLEGLQFENSEMDIFGWGGNSVVSNVEDVEWDKANGFLGFTATVTSRYFGSDLGAKVRFNFKAFQHNDKFEQTPFHNQNGRLFNALHIIGSKTDDVTQIWSAAKWDLSKTHDIYTYGFPPEYMPIAQKVIDQWNAAFKSIGKPAAFKLNTQKMKYPYDLRYPMMVWVDDPLISQNSPLGIGMALADVRNGELQWGQITLYGGILEHYIKSYLGPVDSSDGANAKSAGTAKFNQQSAYFQTYFNPAKAPQAVPGLDANSLGRLEARLHEIAPKINTEDLVAQSLAAMSIRKGEKPTAAQLETANAQAAAEFRSLTLQRTSMIQKSLRKGFEQADQGLQTGRQRVEAARTDVRALYGFSGAPSAEIRTQYFGKDESSMTGREKLSKLATASAADLSRASGAAAFDFDRRLMDIGPSLIAAFAKTRISYDDGLKKVVHELILHEFGHMLGLGHQFKENIVPADGTVPAKYITELKKGVANGYTNSTSVMGYKHPMTELTEDEEKIAPGPQDLLTLRYLYNQEYATFRRGSDDEDFSFAKVPASGMIPSRNPDRPEQITSYFPQCNDYDASFSADPYCNRFDRGNDAQSIVKTYLDDLNANMVSKVYAFTDARGGSTDEMEYYMKERAMTALGRVRVFYDSMRQKFEPEIRSISNSERDLYEFSSVCAGEKEGSANLKRIFADKPELKELCIVNRMAVREIANLLAMPGPDRARMNWDSAVIQAGMSGGDAENDTSRMFGTHSAISVMPIKLAAMNALTTPYPYLKWGPWTFPIPRFTGSDGLFSYSSLYPVEFTEAIATSVEKNLKFDSATRTSGTIGWPIMSMGSFLDDQTYGNDSTRLPKEFVENVRSQTNFRFSINAIILTMKAREDKSRVTHFEAELYDPNSNRSQKMPEAYVLPGGKLIVRPANRNFVAPITKIMFISDDIAIAWAYHIEYDKKYDDVLAAHSAKATLEKLNNSLIDSCIRGDNDGLASHFNAQKPPETYPGFFVMSGIADDEEKQLTFLRSVRENFDSYAKLTKTAVGESSTPERCEKAVNGVTMLVSTAAILNGYFLPEVLRDLVK